MGIEGNQAWNKVQLSEHTIFECIAQMGYRINVGIKVMWLLLNKDLENLGFGSGRHKKLGESIMA